MAFSGMFAHNTILESFKHYTKTTTFFVQLESSGGFELFCDEGDTVITGYFKDVTVPVDQHTISQSNSIQNSQGTIEGWKIRMQNGGSTSETLEGRIICADTNP